MSATGPGRFALRDMLGRLGPGVADWELKADLALLKQLELVDSRGRGRVAYWRLRRK